MIEEKIINANEEPINHIITSRLQEAYCSHHPKFKKEIEGIKYLFIANIH